MPSFLMKKPSRSITPATAELDSSASSSTAVAKHHLLAGGLDPSAVKHGSAAERKVVGESGHEGRDGVQVNLNESKGLEKKHGVLLIETYLRENVNEFRRLAELREQGWNNPAGDTYFQKQRQKSDNADEKLSQIFYKMMKRIGLEMHRMTDGALAIPTGELDNNPKILDICCAPGGFLETSLSINPSAIALGLSLPVSQSGHKMYMPENSHASLKFFDITMLAADMGVTDIPHEHPDAENFLPQQFSCDERFDLIVCDGQILRTHVRATYRESREALRLTVTQLVIGLEHLEAGGTIIILLHKVEAIDTVGLLYTFNKFSSLQLFKPAKEHAKRSSFYMVATNVQSKHPEAIQAVETWKSQYKIATFGTDAEYENKVRTKCLDTEKVLEEFGPELVRLGRKIWAIQAKALAKAPFMKKGTANYGTAGE